MCKLVVTLETQNHLFTASGKLFFSASSFPRLWRSLLSVLFHFLSTYMELRFSLQFHRFTSWRHGLWLSVSIMAFLFFDDIYGIFNVLLWFLHTVSQFQRKPTIHRSFCSRLYSCPLCVWVSSLYPLYFLRINYLECRDIILEWQLG